MWIIIRPKIVFFFIALMGMFGDLKAQDACSPITEKTIARFRKLDEEIEYGRTVAEKLLLCSYLQDAWLVYLHEAENEAAFLTGMAEIERLTDVFRENINYAATIVNFYNPGKPRTLFPQRVPLLDERAFLNTFKTGRSLNFEEREQLFDFEWTQYQNQSLCQPFMLDQQSLMQLESGRIYNFVLLPNGGVRIALEKPGGKEYGNGEVVNGEFAYPNHTILAGSPHQPVMTAGALVLYRVEDRCLFFISNKSGHFVPSFKSLSNFKRRLEKMGVAPQTVILVPTVDLGDVVLSIYYNVQIPVSLIDEDAKHLFQLASKRWLNALEELDLNLLEELAKGNCECLFRDSVAALSHVREEATYMRSAYHLFAEVHQVPKPFHKFVKHFGGLKDAIKHGVTPLIQSEAVWVLNFLREHKEKLRQASVETTSEEDLYEFLMHELHIIKSLLSCDELSLDEFHLIKKTARELGAFFLYLSEDAYGKGRNFSIYQAAAWRLFRINQQMAVIHDEQIGKILHGHASPHQILVKVPLNIQNQLNRILDQLGIAPSLMDIKINPTIVEWLIHAAKDWGRSGNG